MPGQSGSNLLLFSFPHIHSAATFCLKATLSHEHSLRPLLSDERGENRGGGGGGRRWEVRWGEEGEVGGRVTVVIKAQYYKQREKGNESRRLTPQLRWRRQSEARYNCLIRSEKKKRKGTKKQTNPKPKQKLPKWRESDSRSRDSLPSFHHDTPATASGSHLISFILHVTPPTSCSHCSVLLKAKWKIKEEIQRSSEREKENSFFFWVIISVQ